MTLIEKMNKETNAYFDQENLVEYLFTGWDEILPIEEKLKLMKRFPHKRQIPIGLIFENSLAKVVNDFPKTERKVIHRKEVEGQKD